MQYFFKNIYAICEIWWYVFLLVVPFVLSDEVEVTINSRSNNLLSCLMIVTSLLSLWLFISMQLFSVSNIMLIIKRPVHVIYYQCHQWGIFYV